MSDKDQKPGQCSSASSIPVGQQSSPQFSTTPSNTTAPSSPVLLACTASGNPVPTISWYRDGVLLDVQTEPGLSTSPGGLSATDQASEGTYQCQASNGAGAVRSLPAHLQRAGKRCISE